MRANSFCKEAEHWEKHLRWCARDRPLQRCRVQAEPVQEGPDGHSWSLWVETEAHKRLNGLASNPNSPIFKAETWNPWKDMVSVHTHSHIHPLAHVNTHLCTHRQPSGNSKASSQNSQPEYLKDKQRRGLGQPSTYTLAARAGLEGGRVGSQFQGGARLLPGLRSPTCPPV